jgi:nucleoside-diphosphate-sugar epimerase
LGTSLKETHLPNCIGKACGLACKLLATIGFYSSSLNTIWNMVLDMACDISKAKRELNYNPRVSIEEGIKKIIEFYLKKEFAQSSS